MPVNKKIPTSEEIGIIKVGDHLSVCFYKATAAVKTLHEEIPLNSGTT